MLLLAVLACLPIHVDTADVAETGDAGDSGDTAPATLELRFVMDADLIAEMAELPIGTFLGSIYAEADATGFGPNEGAVPLLDFESDPIDLSAGGGPSDVAFAGGELEPQVIWILGCLDADDNDCEKDDPITHPNDNKFAIVAGSNPIDVTMELLNPR
ncbi:MAG: hypothetical protein EXR71_07980 [Myxococcales bacterium]|nr:hypothetical protein [Myxococcales bacterium]